MAKIGLEIHAVLNTKSKLFCSCSTKQSDKPNSQTCPTCLGMPGSRPVLNSKALEKGLMVALALNCKPLDRIHFSRKAYFYPDMSKNFQITQYEKPLAEKGYLEIPKKIRVRRVHLEEDPAQIIHVGGDITNAEYCLLDYNRSGIPLLEIVTEPDLSSGEEAEKFLSKLKSIFEHLGTTPVFKADVNISAENHSRVEIKNVTGIKVIRKAIEYELWRQEGRKDEGQHTRLLKLKPLTTEFLRSKETEEEYGYIFEPDLPVFETKIIAKRIVMPELPDLRIKRFEEEYELSKSKCEVIVLRSKGFADFFEVCTKKYNDYENLANWTSTFLIKTLNYNSIELSDTKVSVKQFVDLLKKIDGGKITSAQAKEFLKTKEFLEGKLITVRRAEIDLDEVIKEVIRENCKVVEKYKKGKKTVLEYLVGQVMKKTGKSVEPDKIRKKLVNSIN